MYIVVFCIKDNKSTFADLLSFLFNILAQAKLGADGGIRMFAQ